LFFDFTFREEGGYVNDPHDRGGATSGGVTQVVYTAYRYRHNLPSQAVRLITLDEVRDIYKTQYFDACSCGVMDPWYAVAIGDTAILCGPGYAIAWARLAVNLPVSHQVSPALFAALHRAGCGPTIDNYIDLRIGHHQRVAVEHPDQGRFLEGWLARAERLRAYSKKLADVTELAPATE